MISLHPNSLFMLQLISRGAISFYDTFTVSMDLKEPNARSYLHKLAKIIKSYMYNVNTAPTPLFCYSGEVKYQILLKF